MFPILSLGPLAIQAPLLILLIGVWIGYEINEKSAAFYQVSMKHIEGLLLSGFAAGLIGARIFYLLRYPIVLHDSLMNVFALDPSMLDIGGGLLVFFLVVLIYGQRHKMSLWQTFDCITPLLSIVAVALSLANFASGDAYGTPSQLPWSVELWAAERHPVQLYEAFAGLCIAVMVIPGFGIIQRFRNYLVTQEGLSFLLFISFTSFFRILLEYFRADHSLYAGLINPYQVFYWIALAACLCIMLKRL